MASQKLSAEIHPYSAGLKGGIVGGMAMAIVALAYGIVAYGSPWYPINLLAAAALPMPSQITLEELKAWVANPDAPPFFALLGEYGMGKTTTCKALAKTLLDRREKGVKVPLPIYLDLRHGVEYLTNLIGLA